MNLLAVFILVVFTAFYLLAMFPLMGGWLPNDNSKPYTEGFKDGVLVHLVLAAFFLAVLAAVWAAVTVFK